jgi:hypothetical protein
VDEKESIPFINTVQVSLSAVTNLLSVLPRWVLDSLDVKDLVFVMINNDVLGVIIGDREESIPPRWCLESIMNDHWSVRKLTDCGVTLVVKVLDGIQIQGWAQRLVKEFNAGDYVLIRGCSVL